MLSCRKGLRALSPWKYLGIESLKKIASSNLRCQIMLPGFQFREEAGWFRGKHRSPIE